MKFAFKNDNFAKMKLCAKETLVSFKKIRSSYFLIQFAGTKTISDEMKEKESFLLMEPSSRLWRRLLA